MNLFRRLKRRIGANGPGLTVAVIAMLVALTGGAFAAGGALNATQKKEVKKIAQAEAKKFAGKAGATGPQGPSGAPGAKGDKGDKGDVGPEGKKGEKGEKGTDGKDGKSVEVTPIATGIALECEERGGALVKQEGALEGVEVCDGKEGKEGKEGQPWTPNNTLPSGASETGTWAFMGTTADTKGIRVPISFPIRLKSIIASANVHFEGEENFETSCPGAASLPLAESGQLCVYKNGQEPIQGTTFQGIYKPTEEMVPANIGAGRTGALILFTTPTEATVGSGTFAVKAP